LLLPLFFFPFFFLFCCLVFFPPRFLLCLSKTFATRFLVAMPRTMCLLLKIRKLQLLPCGCFFYLAACGWSMGMGEYWC
jgi:hypothetical protein